MRNKTAVCKRISLLCIVTILALACSALGFMTGSYAGGGASIIGILTSQEGLVVSPSYNLNGGVGEIKSYSYRNVAQSDFESFGSGYGGYYTTSARWQESPVLIETVGAPSSASYTLGDGFCGKFTFVGRGVQTLYSQAGETVSDYTGLEFTFCDESQKITVTLSQTNQNDYLLATVTNGESTVKVETARVNSSISGKCDGKDFPIYLAFDSLTGTLSTRNDNGRTTDTVICTLDGAYTPLQTYSVSLAFIGDGNTVQDSQGNRYEAKGRLLVYELCGQNLTGTAKNTKGAEIGVFGNRPKTYLGGKYTPLPAYAYDILDGDISSAVTVTVKDPSGAQVALDGGRFTASSAGKYTLVYSVTDSGNISSSFEYTVEAVTSLPQLTCTLDKDYQAECGLFERIKVIPANISDTEDYSVVVSSGTNPIVGFTSENLGYFTTSEVGIYTVTYLADNGLGLITSFSYEIVCKNEAGFILDEIPDTVAYNVPYDCGEPTVVFDGTTYDPVLEITSPSNKKSVADGYEFTPVEEGTYTLRFYVDIGGRTFERTFTTQSVFLNSSLIQSVNGFDDRADNYAVTVYDRTVSGGNVSKTLGEQRGVVLTGRTNDQVIRFANPIVIDELSPTTAVVKFALLAGGDYASLSNLEIRLVDRYDSTNYLTVYYSSHASLDYYCYVRAGVRGRQYGRSNEASADDKVWTSLYGTVAMNSLVGSANEQSVYGESKYNTFGFYLDYANKTVSIDNARDWGKGEFYTVVDLDDQAQVGGDIWSGFTAGEAYLEVVVPGNIAKSTAIVVLEVAGQSLGGDEVADGKAPSIRVRTDYTSLPDAKQGVRYAIPVADAIDLICGNMPVEVSVTDSLGNNVAVEDGYITPAELGKYTLTYTTQDKFFNSASKEYEFNVVADIQPINIDWATQPSDNYIAGTTVKIPEVRIGGGSGEIRNTELRILYNGKEIELPESRNITLTEAGSITLELISAEDYINTPIQSGNVLTLNIASPDKVSLEVFGVPQSYAIGYKAFIPEYSAIDYSFAVGDAHRTPSVKVYVNGELVQGDTFTVPDTEKVTLRFEAGEGDRKSERTIEVNTVNPEKLADFFVSPNHPFDALITDDGLALSYTVPKNSNADYNVTFINPVVSDELRLGINIGPCPDGLNFVLPDTIVISIADYYNPDYKLEIRLTPDTAEATKDTHCIMRFNTTKATANRVRGSFALAAESLQSISLLVTDSYVLDMRSSLRFPLSTFSNGEKFTGFPSGLVSVAVRYGGTGKVAGAYITQIGNQVFDSFSYRYGDTTAPMLWTSSAINDGVVIKGEEIVIPYAKAYDALGLYASVTLRVTVPTEDGGSKVLYDAITPREDIVLASDLYGAYTAEYTVTDELGNRQTNTFVFNVRDSVAPVITVIGEIKSEYKAGEELTLPEIYVTSGFDSSPKYEVLIYNTSTRYETLGESTSVVLKAGDCKLVIYAYDSAYNISVTEFEFTVR